MIVQETKGNVISSGLGEARQLRVKLTSKAFRMLVDDIYSNPIKAPIRELCANAADAMIQAGKSAPFRVHLPNRLEPWFSVSDDGVGISKVNIEGLYSTLFDSDKANSNDVTGCFGIGSKSPIAYTDNFVITSKHGGMTYVYSIFIDEVGIPSISQVSECQNNGETGFEVKFAVKQQDFETFRTYAQDILSYFQPRPIVSGNSTFVFAKDKDVLVEGPNYKVFQGEYNESKVVMGNIAYPLSADYNFTQPQRVLVNYGLLLNVPIGSLSITGNREALKYDDYTVKNLKSYFDKALEDIKKFVEKTFDNCKTKWDVRLALNRFSRGSFHTIVNKQNHVFNGKTLHCSIMDDRTHCLKVASGRKTFHGSKTKTIIVSENTFFVIDDLKTGGRGRANYFADDIKHVYLFDCEKSQAEEFIKEEEIPSNQVVFTSSLPKPPVKTRAGVKVDKSLLYKLARPSYYKKSNNAYWQAEEVDVTQGGVYVVLSRFTPVDTVNSDSEHLYETVQHLNKLLDTPITVYGIRKSDEEKLLKEDYGWTKLTEVVEETLDNEKHLVEKLECKELYYSINYGNNTQRAIDKIDHPICDKIKEYHRKYEKAIKSNDLLESFKHLNNAIKKFEIKDTVKKEYDKLFIELSKQYPMFNYCSDAKLLKKYIEQVDFYNESTKVLEGKINVF